MLPTVNCTFILFASRNASESFTGFTYFLFDQAVILVDIFILQESTILTLFFTIYLSFYLRMFLS